MIGENEINKETDEQREERQARERLETIKRSLMEQWEKLPQALGFYESHKTDVCANGRLSEILMRLRLVGAGPLLPRLFPEVALENDLEKTMDDLRALGQSEIDHRWLEFIQQVRDLTEASHAHPTDLASWIIGPTANPFPIKGPEYVLPPDWKYFHETPPLPMLAQVMTMEHIVKRIEDEHEETWLADENEGIEIDPNVDSGQIERLFGPGGPEAMLACLPETIQRAMSKLVLVSQLENTTVEAHGEQHEIALDGRFDYNDRTMTLVINSEQTMERLLQTWFHELGHALIAGDSDTDREIRTRFARTVTTSGLLMPGYASGVYDTEGITRGLEEDFAESIRLFFSQQNDLKTNHPERFAVLEEIVREYIPDFHQETFLRRMNGFVKNAQSRSFRRAQTAA